MAVRALCEFTAKQGDLDLRFTPSPSAQEGMAGHKVVSSRRGDGYEAEVSLAGEYKELQVRGRADGYDPDNNQLEEIKTFRGDLSAMPENHQHLHWAQVKIYGWLLCRQRGLAGLRLALVYFDIGSQQETLLTGLFTAAALKSHFEAHCENFLGWARLEMAHRTARDAALGALKFPHAAFRPGQRDLAEAVYRSVSSRRCLMAQAPTGIGKTMATLFPLLKAVPRHGVDKVFFLAAKTPGRRLALDALALITDTAPLLPLRVIELVARDKACEHPDKACHGASCPLAKGFYDRLPAARRAALAPLAAGLLDKQALRAVALSHAVCPYYLSQDLVRWSDVVVGDYNYYFDVSALLHALTLGNQWSISVLVDEAHNLVDRGRKMYSAELDPAQLAEVRASAWPGLKKPLDRLHRAWRELRKGPHRLPGQAPQPQQAELAGAPAQLDQIYQVKPEPPEKFMSVLLQATSAIAEDLEAHPAQVNSALLRFYFEALHFLRMADSFGKHSLFDMTLPDSPGLEDTGSRRRQPARLGRLCIRNVIPAIFLGPRFAAARSVALFSATLSPQNYHADLLGLPADTVWADIQSPFMAEQLAVRIVTDISTRYQHRRSSLAPISDLMARQFQEKPGNYLVFLSSYDYLAQLAQCFRQRYPHLPMWEQTRRMNEAEREHFLSRFVSDGQGIGFAVLGGSFSEGIDLPGNCLIGAFIATLGLPQVNPVNAQIKLRLAESFGALHAYDYTFLYPGVQKVVQAAGRVIRTPSDQGAIYLMDDRFSRPEVRRLLPAWWNVQQIRIRQHRPAAAEPMCPVAPPEGFLLGP
ncbi:MAG: 2 domain protein [Polaromonas sp.]|nr:2 domain protein [Polaromonas sp.]